MKNKKKICVVGAGKWGINHIKTLDSLNCLGGVVESNKDNLKKIESLYPNTKLSINIDQSFKYDFDGYIIATPAPSHFELAKKVLSNKKPVLVEKPLTLDLKTAMDLNEFSKKEKVLLMVGHVLLFHPAFIKMKSLISEGLIGEMQYIYSNRLNLGTFRKDENVFWSFAPHDISLFNYFFNDTPSKVSSNGLDILQKNIHDITITSFEYGKRKMGHIFVSWLHPFKEHRFVIVGSEGMLHFEDSAENKPLLYYDKKAEIINSVLSPKSGEIKNIQYEDIMPLTAELKYFISNLSSKSVEKAGGDSAVEVMRILENSSKNLIENI